MDSIIITAAVILAVVALIEIVTIFFSLPKEGIPPYVTVLPVFGNDKLFTRRLEYIMQKSCGRRNMIIVDYSANEEQKELCRQFIRDNPDTLFIPSAQLEKIFGEKFTKNLQLEEGDIAE